MVSFVTIIVTKSSMQQNGGDCDVIGSVEKYQPL